MNYLPLIAVAEFTLFAVCAYITHTPRHRMRLTLTRIYVERLAEDAFKLFYGLHLVGLAVAAFVGSWVYSLKFAGVLQ